VQEIALADVIGDSKLDLHSISMMVLRCRSWTPVFSIPLRYNSGMNVQTIVNELREQRDRIQQAIDALERTTHPASYTGKPRGRKPGRHMSADARRRIGLAMKKRWAERKGKKATSTAKKTRQGGISAAGRKRLSEMMKKRWAERKKAAAA
jgi:hypothetical protein